VQARAVARELRDESFAAAYTSPLRRALETAEILGDELGLEFTADTGLEEVDVGSWSGLTRTEAEVRFPAGYTRWLEYGHGWDDGETYEALGDRVVRTLLRLAASHAGETVLLVTHGGPIRSALAAADGLSFDDARRSIHGIGNCARFRLVVRDGSLERVD
jgi:broad specificity phosphatase PhoE